MNPRYRYEITPRAPELGGGWNLKLYDGDQEAGGGVYPVQLDAATGTAWWNHLQEDQRAWWLEWLQENDGNGPPTAANAYAASLLNEAYQDAADTGDEWVESRMR